MRSALLPLSAIVLACSMAACGGGSQPAQAPASAPAAQPSAAVNTDKNAYPVFLNADEGADPAVPAAQGGKGFSGEGWETNTGFDLIGDPRAVKGGALKEYVLDFPGTLRIEGPESNTALNYMIGPMVYESLLSIHPTSLDYMPVLATHWQISADHALYRYRLNPNARWSDGQPVVADDVVASWNFLMDKGLQSPSSQMTFGKFEKPVAESKYIVSVKSKVLNWRNFLYFSGMSILPAHILKNVDGAAYLKDYNFKLMPGSGPYKVEEADIVKGKSVTIRRRSDYWAEKYRRNVGLNNFDEIREIVVRDQKLAFEMFKKGDIDDYYVNVSREWVEEMNFDRVQRGLIQKRKIFNDSPSGFSGIAFNTRKEPFSDIRVRKALTLLQNRDELIKKLFFNEYVPLNSYHAGGIYENKNNPKNLYDQQAALALLAEAGWKDRDGQGRLVKNGQPLTLELLYSGKGSEAWMTVYQEELRKVGIALNLRLVTPETLFKLVMDRNFTMVSMAWGALLFPNPETSFGSALADQNNNNNITGFKDKRVDELLTQYDQEFDQKKRAAIIQEVDGIVANSYQYLLGWDAPFQRIAYWNKFGQPEGYLTRVGDYRDIPSLWWIDAAKEADLRRAMGDASVKLPVGETEVRYWPQYGEREKAAAAPK
ncbi:MAG TPA: extracellular solute-binding protein [Vicinamibacterales bacterium]|nr:extracellular solute-binding protein [Vicinamibacterales bacterium]